MALSDLVAEVTAAQADVAEKETGVSTAETQLATAQSQLNDANAALTSSQAANATDWSNVVAYVNAADKYGNPPETPPAP